MRLRHVSIGIRNGNKVVHVVLPAHPFCSAKHVGPDQPPLVLGFVVRHIALCVLGFIPMVYQSVGLNGFL